MGYHKASYSEHERGADDSSHGVDVAHVDAIFCGGHWESQNARVDLQHLILLSFFPFPFDLLVVGAGGGARVHRYGWGAQVVWWSHHPHAE